MTLPTESIVAQGQRDVVDIGKYASTCKPDKEKTYVDGFFYSESAMVAHFYKEPWQRNLTKGEQILELCVKAYYGTDRSADCDEALTEDIRLAQAWKEMEELPRP